MLEKYIPEFDAEEFLRDYMAKNDIHRTRAIQLLRKSIPKEPYFQDKIRKALKKRYPTAFIRKIAQGEYSEAGIPDLMMVYRGHYFGFEVKRPLLGEPTGIQLATIRQIECSGGTAAIISWPEQAFLVVDAWACGL